MSHGALGVEQQAKVNQLIADLKAHGKSIVVISHNLEHVFEVADRVVVLRRGRNVGTRIKSETTKEEIVGLITGAIPGDVVEPAAVPPRPVFEGLLAGALCSPQLGAAGQVPQRHRFLHRRRRQRRSCLCVREPAPHDVATQRTINPGVGLSEHFLK